MKQRLKQSNSPVFEMVLDNLGQDQAKMEAIPSNFKLPEEWHEEYQEGQLAVDVAQNENEVLIVSTMAGAQADKIEVYVRNDLLTIRGWRNSPLLNISEDDYFYQECFWGKFSRTVVLPVDVKGDLSKAEYKNGVLIIKIPKQKTRTQVKINIVEE